MNSDGLRGLAVTVNTMWLPAGPTEPTGVKLRLREHSDVLRLFKADPKLWDIWDPDYSMLSTTVMSGSRRIKHLIIEPGKRKL